MNAHGSFIPFAVFSPILDLKLLQKPLLRIENKGRLAGLLYLLSGIPSGFYLMYVDQVLIVPGNAAATASNILANETLFRLGIVSELVSTILFIFVVRALHSLLSGVNRGNASLMVTLWMVSVPVSFANVLSKAAALILLSGGNFLSVFQTNQLRALAMVFLNLHSEGITVVSIFWGLWLLPFGLLVYRSGFIPRILGIFLMTAGIAIVANSLVDLLLPQFANAVSPIELSLDALGEGSILAWLIVKGANVPQIDSNNHVVRAK